MDLRAGSLEWAAGRRPGRVIDDHVEDAADEVRALSTLKIIVDTQSDSCRLGDDLARVVARFEAETLP